MRRWHAPREHSIMFRRWKMEMEKHGYDWRNPPDPKCDRDACHCAAGIGSMRKRRPYDCGNPRCGLCHEWVGDYRARKHRERREAIAFEMKAAGL